jgi:endonuclease III
MTPRKNAARSTVRGSRSTQRTAVRTSLPKRPKRVPPGVALEYIRRLEATYPDAKCSLDHRNPYELLVATILSAQCTDARVNMVTPSLFARFPDASALAEADQGDLEERIKSTGFFRNKAKSLLGMARAVVDRHRGAIPDSMEELTELPGVGRKTANVILGNAFGKNTGVVVDTHVTRVSFRLGLTRETDAVKIEQDLMKVVPREKWTPFSHLLIFHGRSICVARRPLCEQCPLWDICPSSLVLAAGRRASK